MKWIMLAVCVLMMGCQQAFQQPVDPNVAANVEVVAETTLTVMTALSPFFPILLPVIAAGVGGLATWKKVKPKLLATQTKEKLYYKTTEAVVTAIEGFKVSNPDDWEKLEAKLIKTIGPEANNVIRALRGLTPTT